MIATTTTTKTMGTKTVMGTTANSNMHANAAGAPLPLLPRRVSSSSSIASSIASASSAASVADLLTGSSSNNLNNEDDGSSSSSGSSTSSTPRKARRVRGMRGVPPPELAGASSSSPSTSSMDGQEKSIPFPTSPPPAPAAAATPSPIQKSQPLLYTPGMSLMSLRLASLPRPQQSPKARPGPLPLSPPSSSSMMSGGQYTSSVLSYAPASYSKPTSAPYSKPASASHAPAHGHAHPVHQRSLSSPPAATPTPKTPTTPLTPGGTPEVRKKCGQLVKSSLKSSRSYSSSSSMSISSSSSINSISSMNGTGASPLPASSSGLSVYTNGSGAYASSRSEPTTPTASKAVHFDNARLEFVRLFLAEQKPLAVSRDGSPTPDGDGEYEYDSSSGVSGGEGREWPGYIFDGGSANGNGKEWEKGGEGGEDRTRLAMHLTLAPPPGLLTDPRLVALESMRLVQSSSLPAADDNGDHHHKRDSQMQTAVVHGSVRVRNLAYSKAVWARFTLDGWRTTSEVCARWIESVGGAMDESSVVAPVRGVGVGSDDLGAAIAAEEEARRRRRGAEWDRFAFTIDLSGLALAMGGDLAIGAGGGAGGVGGGSGGKERRLELAVKYVVEGREQEAMWDNNGGRNYVATFVRERVSVSSAGSTSTSTSSASSSASAQAIAMAKNVAAANQAYYALQQQHLPHRRQSRRLRVQEQAVEDGSGSGSGSSEESTETEARAVSRRSRGRGMGPVRAASLPAGSGASGQPSMVKGRSVGVRATEEERDMADLRNKLEKVAAQGDGRGHAHQHQHQITHHASARLSPSRVGGGSSSSSQSSTPTTHTYNAMHHMHSMSMSASMAGTNSKSKRRSESPTEYAARLGQTGMASPSPVAPRASTIHHRTQSFPQSSWRAALAQQQHHQHQASSAYGVNSISGDGAYGYAHSPSPSTSFSGARSPQQHLGSPRDLWDGDDAAFRAHAPRVSSERGYFDILPLSSQPISRSTGSVNANAVRVTITGSTPSPPSTTSKSSSSAASSSSHSPSSSPPLASTAYPPSSAARGVGLGMSLLSPDSALSTPGMVSPASTSSSSSSSEDDDEDDDEEEIDVALAGRLELAAAAHQHQLALGLEDAHGHVGDLAGVVPLKDVAAATEVDIGVSAETPYRQFLNKFCFFTGPGTGATSPLNTTVSLVPGSAALHAGAGVVDSLNAHAMAYQALPGASPPRHQRAHGHGHGHGRPTPSSSVETVVGLGARA